ncbi:MAG TPA: lysophospholipid acyltransferase family protein [Ferruginibacter sp.]|nr:lysophospholipid acyltransferase family protein [Ferruginibacter sp.]HMP21443.1 lysophospholipid acyltransferase family protein [Ferruginibacter sp.]
MAYLFFPVRLLFTLYALALFMAFMFLVFPLVVILSFWGKIKGGNIIYVLCRCWADCLMPLWGIFHRNIYALRHDTSRQYVFVFNHISYMDIPVLLSSIRRQRFRILGKAELAKIPVFGFIYRNAVVLVDRSNPEKRAKSVLQLKSVINKGISVVIAPEGTFNATGKPLKDFYDGAFRIAIETQTPVKPLLLLDTYDRMSYKSIFSLTPGKSRTVFLEEVPVEGLTLNDIPALKEKVYLLMEEQLKAYKATWIKQ